MKVEVSFANSMLVQDLPVEFVERKGKGHPDTLCDRAAEEMSIALSEYYLDKFGKIFHHNVDKCVLVGGQAKSWFGGGEVTEPIQILLIGRAVGKVNGSVVPIESIAEDTTRSWLAKDIHHLDAEKNVRIGTKIRSGSVDLVKNFDLNGGIPLANDTSFGVSYAPMSETEKLVLEEEKELNSEATKRKFPQIGEDIKVMGVRTDSSIVLTVACAIISEFVKDENSYRDTKETIRDIAKQVADKHSTSNVTIQVNTADNFSEKLYYLTVTGTSAEHGDDGQVGRGNRANGLITPFRPMTLEATCGKNPINHTGKMYQVVANKIVERVLKEVPSVEQVSSYLVSEIGKPIDKPQVVNVEVHSEKNPALQKVIGEIVNDSLSQISGLWKEIIKREHSLF